jgi:hypothetical protein
MLHVWLFRASPDGVFSEVNSSVGRDEVLLEGAVK